MNFFRAFECWTQRRTSPAAVALCLALLAAGCEKKMAKATPPVLVPSIESSPQPAAEEPQAASEPAPSQTPEATRAPQPQEAQKPRPKTRKPVARKPAAPVIAAPKEAVRAEPPKQEPQPQQPEIARPAPPDNSAQITAAVPPSAMQSQLQSTEQLLRNSSAKLQGVNRPLS